MKTLVQIVQMLPTLIDAVKAAEAAVPVSGQGKAKLDFVLGTIQDAYGEVSTLLPQITSVVGRIVSLFNSTGWGQAPAGATNALAK